LDDTILLITFVVGMAVGQYTVFSLVLSKGFIDRFKEFKSAFDQWMRLATVEFIEDLQDIVQAPEPIEVLNFVSEWTERQKVVSDIMEEYNKLERNTRYIIYTLGASALCGFFYKYKPEAFELVKGASTVTWFQLAQFFAFLGVALIFYYLIQFTKLNSKISKFELGISVERIIEEELVKEEE